MKQGGCMCSETVNTDRIHFSPADGNTIVVVQPYDMNQYDLAIAQCLKMLAQQQKDALHEAAKFFLGSSYFLEPLGEGKDAKYSQEPLYRTDKFDCVSYVNTVLALIHAKNIVQFRKNILAIRYSKSEIGYTNRTDWFTDLEWIPNTQQLSWIKDVTEKIVDMAGQPIRLIAETAIDKPNWYKVRPLKAMHLLAPLPDPSKANVLLTQLQSNSGRFQARSSQLSYLPLNKLFNADGNANTYYFNQIPPGSVIAIVRPNWDIRNHFPGFPAGYGTNLNVSHLGFAIRTGQDLMFYNASSIHGRVEAEPLTQYLQKYIHSPTIKGIHIEQIIY